MTKQELKEAIINLIATKNYTINREVEMGKPFGFFVLGTTITIQVPEWKEKRFFNALIEQHASDLPNFNSLSYEDSLELLFIHYPFSYTNDSNCVLLDGKGYIIAIQWNGCKSTIFFCNQSLLQERNSIVINNKKQLALRIKKKQFNEEMRNWLTTNFC